MRWWFVLVTQEPSVSPLALHLKRGKTSSLKCEEHSCNETNLMHYLSSVYSVTTPLHVSGLLVALHQDVAMYMCDSWYVLYVLVYYRRAWLGWDGVCHVSMSHSNQANWQSTKMYNMYQLSHIYIVTSWRWATSKPKMCRGIVTQ
jgi:hypothetical protein